MASLQLPGLAFPVSHIITDSKLAVCVQATSPKGRSSFYREAFPVRLESKELVYSVHSCIVQAVIVHIVIY